MKQIIQSFKTGKTILEEVPVPVAQDGTVVIRSVNSLVSLGTEKMLVEFGKANLVSKAKQQPDKVKMVLDKIKSDGLLPTLESVFSKLEQPLPLGYCNAGIVVEVGINVSGFKAGDRVISNGPHAEYVSVPENLVAHIPDNVSFEEAAFTVVSAIGLQGIRLCKPTFGETIVVYGLGLIGLITVQLLKANGCKVIGIDLDEHKLEKAVELGVEVINPAKVSVVESVLASTNNIGADGVLITASANTNEIISNAAKLSRKRGRIVLVGVIGLNLSRADFYEKELSFQVSCSYGPGRYDDDYEQKGIDYPLPFVRWTEKRNFEAILNSISTGGLNVKSLITENVSLDDYLQIYGEIGKSKNSIASLISYKNDSVMPDHSIKIVNDNFKGGKGIIGIIGAGNFTKMTMLPAFKKCNAKIKYIVSAGGVNGNALAKKYGISYSSSDYHEILNDEEVDIVIITTRHNLHASMVFECLNAGKSVFVEKPLALTKDELNKIEKAYLEAKGKDDNITLTVGFNRRFSPHIKVIKNFTGGGKIPINITATMNAGFIPQNVWVHDMKIGGGRIIGEACHYIDLVSFVAGSRIKSVFANSLGENPQENTDNVSILLKMENGTNAVVNYFSNGSKAYSKERLEVYFQNSTIVMDNFRQTKGYSIGGLKKIKTKLDKGHLSQFEQLIESIEKGGDALIPFEEILNSSKATFAVLESLQKGSWINID